METMRTSYLTVDREVSDVLPEVFINYLWSLALSDDNINTVDQQFILVPGKVNGRGVQDIVHTSDELDYEERYRVFGMPPVQAILQIFYMEGGYRMSLKYLWTAEAKTN